MTPPTRHGPRCTCSLCSLTLTAHPGDGSCHKCGFAPVNAEGLCDDCAEATLDYAGEPMRPGAQRDPPDTPAVLDAVAEKVLSYRPVDKGLAAKKTARKLKRKAKADD